MQVSCVPFIPLDSLQKYQGGKFRNDTAWQSKPSIFSTMKRPGGATALPMDEVNIQMKEKSRDPESNVGGGEGSGGGGAQEDDFNINYLILS